MASAIPVFKFAFAAYAAKAARATFGDEEDGPYASDLFLAMWHLLPPGGGDVMVRVGFIADQARAAPPGPGVETVWLGEIVESRGQFSGRVKTGLKALRPGQRLFFKRAEIQGWRLGVNAAARSGDGPHLADLETV